MQTEIAWKDFEKAIKKLHGLVENPVTAQKMDALKAIIGKIPHHSPHHSLLACSGEERGGGARHDDVLRQSSALVRADRDTAGQRMWLLSALC